MPYQNIDATLTSVDFQAAQQAFADVLSKLPFLVSLTTGDRKAIFKTGPDRVSFVQNASTAGSVNPDIFPGTFNLSGFLRDVQLFDQLTQLGTLADSVASQIDDTRLAVGGEAMKGAVQVYNYVREASKTTPGLKPLADQLGEQFQKANKPKPPTPPTP